MMPDAPFHVHVWGGLSACVRAWVRTFGAAVLSCCCARMLVGVCLVVLQHLLVAGAHLPPVSCCVCAECTAGLRLQVQSALQC